MIIGFGSDIVNIKRIKKLHKKWGARFEQRVFTDKELEEGRKFRANSKAHASYLAKRFAAKEAFGKALGFGLGRYAGFREISVGHDVSGKPVLLLEGKALASFRALAQKRKTLSMHLTLSDDYPFALAVVAIDCNS